MTDQEKEDYKIGVEKLLNSMGRNTAIKYYGFDGYYSVENITVYDDGYVTLDVTMDKPLPNIMDVKIEPNFIYGKYATASDLIGNLEYLLRYLGNSRVSVNLIDNNPVYDTYNEKIEGHEFKENPENFIHLCNGSVVEKSSGYSYPLFSNGMIDVAEPNHLASIDDHEWWDSLCDEDKIELNKTYS